MEPLTRVSGRALPLDRSDVDTDQIIPSHWLKRVERTGYAAGLFEAWRKDPAFVLNDARYRGASILVVGPNFGCGSSREHAAWALLEAGFRAVVSPRCADIFRSNAVKNGLVPAEVDAAALTRLLRAVEADPSLELIVDLERRDVAAPKIGLTTPLVLDESSRTRLLGGLDDIALTLRHEEAISAYEALRPEWLPRVR